ncbi:hypothetical protein [Mycetocola zhujimingii]|uniref:Uncharacterized protein n=1 Tax=Mycetocola zhujimingii TaxID=2079792 RepID=A0A2U1TB50_9MICO|nr:hypothetical protein [Mycetocola zhujimingii]PWC06125.1 hypothetical protein DF223_10875 [Mycetocola zhujimingii]
MSTQWTGHNWQLIDPEDSLTMVGVTFGIGTLNEPLEAVGSLSIALAALKAELTRPVELGDGRTYVPEGLVELHSDTASIAIRGSLEGVTAAWRRLPTLSADAISDDVSPVRPEHPIWPADLLIRTGRNAAVLSRWQLTAPDVHERASALLVQLDPSAGNVPAVFFTTDESLVGMGFPVREGAAALTPVTWADGTAQPDLTPGADPTALANNRAGLLPRPEEDVLCSALVPRTPAGAAAADVLRAQLQAMPANSRAGLTVRGIVVGLGASYCVFLVADRVPDEATRRMLLGEFSRNLGMVPDPWFDIAAVEVSRQPSPRLERERRVFGLDPVLEATSADIRQAVACAAETIHLALGLSPAELDTGSRLNLGSIPGDLEPLVGFWEPQLDGAHEFRSTGANGTPVTTVAVTPNSILLPARRPENMPGPATQWEGVDASRLLAVVNDGAGTITFIDESMATVSFAPAQFPDPDQLMQIVGYHLAGVVQLSFLSAVRLPNDPPPAPGGGSAPGGSSAPGGGWVPGGLSVAATAAAAGARSRRRPRPASSKPSRHWLPRVLGSLTAAALVTAFMLLRGVIDGPAVTKNATFGDTVRLANETEITARDFDVVVPGADQTEYLVSATIEFCAGGDTEVNDLPPETQRTVSPEDFVMVNKDGQEGRLIDSDDQLTKVTLDRDECTTGELVFESPEVFTPSIAYANELGDEITWLE